MFPRSERAPTNPQRARVSGAAFRSIKPRPGSARWFLVARSQGRALHKLRRNVASKPARPARGKLTLAAAPRSGTCHVGPPLGLFTLCRVVFSRHTSGEHTAHSLGHSSPTAGAERHRGPVGFPSRVAFRKVAHGTQQKK